MGSYLEVNPIPLVAQILQSHLRPLFHDLILKNIFKVEPVLVDCLDPELLRRENLTQHCHNRPGQRGFFLQNESGVRSNSDDGDMITMILMMTTMMVMTMMMMMMVVMMMTMMMIPPEQS